ncbi:MAG: tetratricopeptide repeat protein, partial [Desulfovibrionaceae bacterium]
VLLHRQGRIDEAKQHYEKALAQRPDYLDAMNNLGNILREQGLAEQAVSLYEKILERDQNHAEAWANLGAARKDLGDTDQAVACYEKALAVRPDYLDALLNLTRILQQLGRLTEAEDAARRAISLRDDDETRFRLAAVLQEQGRTDEAAEDFQRCLELSPEDSWGARLCLARLGKADAPERAPDAFVRSLFDYYAVHFDAHLQEALEYKGPTVLLEALAGFIEPEARPDVLDLGCGTGLCGVVLKPYAKTLAGVDLSPGMIEQARRREIYDDLAVGEVTSHLQNRPGAFDLVAAGDVLVYLGELGPVLKAAAGALRPDGLLVFTVERQDEPGYSLGDSMRYAHSRDYLEQTARQAGFEVKLLREASTRKEVETPVPGWVAVLRRRKRVNTRV